MGAAREGRVLGLVALSPAGCEVGGRVLEGGVWEMKRFLVEAREGYAYFLSWSLQRLNLQQEVAPTVIQQAWVGPGSQGWGPLRDSCNCLSVSEFPFGRQSAVALNSG